MPMPLFRVDFVVAEAQPLVAARPPTQSSSLVALVDFVAPGVGGLRPSSGLRAVAAVVVRRH